MEIGAKINFPTFSFEVGKEIGSGGFGVVYLGRRINGVKQKMLLHVRKFVFKFLYCEQIAVKRVKKSPHTPNINELKILSVIANITRNA